MKIARRALAICLIALLASGLSILTAGVVVNAYVRSALSSLDIQLDTPAPGIGGLLRTLAGSEPKAKPGSKPGGQSTAEGGGASPRAGASAPGGQAAAGTPSPAGVPAEGPAATPGAEEPLGDALPVMGGVDDAAAGEADGADAGAAGADGDRQLVMTPESLQEMKSGIPSAEKISIFNMLMKKVPQEEMQKISAAMEGGLTAEELAQIQVIIRKYVTTEEYNQLMKLISSGSNSP